MLCALLLLAPAGGFAADPPQRRRPARRRRRRAAARDDGTQRPRRPNHRPLPADSGAADQPDQLHAHRIAAARRQPLSLACRTRSPWRWRTTWTSPSSATVRSWRTQRCVRRRRAASRAASPPASPPGPSSASVSSAGTTPGSNVSADGALQQRELERGGRERDLRRAVRRFRSSIRCSPAP